MNSVLEIADRFSKSLDDEDYASAQNLINHHCVYRCRGKVYHVPKAIIDSYQLAGDSARCDFDKIEYESRVIIIPENTALIRFIDHFYKGDDKFTFNCEQLIEVNAEGQIILIVHRDFPQELQNLQDFINRIDNTE